jgi:hypothetical protein
VLESWVINTDMFQIATSLDKAYANTADRRYMFWNITLTYLLSVCPATTTLTLLKLTQTDQPPVYGCEPQGLQPVGGQAS